MKRLSKKSGFTLIEALLVIAIIAVMSSMSLMVLADAANSAKISRAKVQIRKINDLIMDRWEEFQSRPLPFRSPIRFPPLCGTKNNGRIRLYALRELMRLEMPDRYTDILSGAQEIPFELYDANGNLVDPHPAPMVPQFFNVGSNSLHDFYMRQLTPNCWRFVIRSRRACDRWHQGELSRQPDSGDANVRVVVGQRLGNVVLAAAFDLAQQPQRASTQPWVRVAVESKQLALG